MFPTSGAAIALLITSASVAYSQVSVQGSLVGSVADPSGQLVSGAKVSIARTATNLQRTAETDAAGRFQLSGLPPGLYNLSVEKPGF